MHLNRLCGYLKSLRRMRLPNVTIWKQCGAARRAATLAADNWRGRL